MSVEEDWVDQRDRGILETIYYCETCNIVMELGDADIAIHKRELPHHKMRRVMIVKCAHCKNIVTDSYAEYVQDKNEFWCRNCLFDERTQGTIPNIGSHRNSKQIERHS